jgi:hypothetical protein
MAIQDLSSTQITSHGLRSISPQSRLQHLYLGNCGGIRGRALLTFLLDHPASTCLESLNIRVNDELNHPLERRDVPVFLSALKSKGTLRALDICGVPVGDELAFDFPPTLVELGIHRTGLSPYGIQALLAVMPDLFYLDIEANLSGGRLRLSQYADVFTSIRHHHSHVKIVECSGSGIEATDEICDILFGWHWLHGRSRRGYTLARPHRILMTYRWLINKSEYELLRSANSGIVKAGWKANKLNCCSSRKDLHVYPCDVFNHQLMSFRDFIGIMLMVVKALHGFIWRLAFRNNCETGAGKVFLYTEKSINLVRKSVMLENSCLVVLYHWTFKIIITGV